MKQGPSKEMSYRKEEPKSHAMNVDTVGQMGTSVSFVKQPLHQGRGFSAPKDAAASTHKTGSQGRH